MMLHSDGIADASLRDFEAWRDSISRRCGAYRSEGAQPKAFQGWVRSVDVNGLAALDVGCNAHQVARTRRDIRLDGVEHYFALIQLSGSSSMIQNDHRVRLSPGDIMLVDSGRPISFFGDGTGARWLSLRLPRRVLLTHLGFEPQGGSFRSGKTLAGRLLKEVIIGAVEAAGSPASSADSHMQSVAYDLVGALFAPSGPLPVSRSTDLLFTRICGIIRDGFADSDFGPVEVAAEAGISLRYLQKLFTERGTTCREFINSLRLDRAAHLLRRRASRDTGQPLTEIAYGSGFRDYAHFARKFRRRTGSAPGAYSGAHAEVAGAATTRAPRS